MTQKVAVTNCHADAQSMKRLEHEYRTQNVTWTAMGDGHKSHSARPSNCALKLAHTVRRCASQCACDKHTQIRRNYFAAFVAAIRSATFSLAAARYAHRLLIIEPVQNI